VEESTNNDTLFPTSQNTPFPKNFQTTIKQIFTRMFRIFAIIYTQHYTHIENLGACAHLNTSCKHFLYFVWEFGLVADRELEALPETLLTEIKAKYNEGSVRGPGSSSGAP
jgi:MOB kinase activator 1